MNYKSVVKTNRDEFFSKCDNIASTLNIPSIWLQHIMYSESGLNHLAVNGIGAVGLIQFTKSTAKSLGTSADALLKMTNVQQLDYVLKYFKIQIATYGTPKSILDAYLLVFYPAMVKKDENFSLPATMYASNKGMDMNKDGKITKSDVKAYLEKRIGEKISLSPGLGNINLPLLFAGLVTVGFFLLRRHGA